MITISNHPHVYPSRRKIAGLFARLIMGFSLFAVVGFMLVAVFTRLPLFVLGIPFVLGLNIPMLLLTSLHPSVSVLEDGLMVEPLVWRGQFLAWSDIAYITNHHLLPPPAPERQILKSNRPPQEGLMVVAVSGKMAWHYRFVGLMAGEGLMPVFGVTNHTHEDYNTLRDTLKRELPMKETE